MHPHETALHALVTRWVELALAALPDTTVPHADTLYFVGCRANGVGGCAMFPAVRGYAAETRFVATSSPEKLDAARAHSRSMADAWHAFTDTYRDSGLKHPAEVRVTFTLATRAVDTQILAEPTPQLDPGFLPTASAIVNWLGDRAPIIAARRALTAEEQRRADHASAYLAHYHPAARLVSHYYPHDKLVGVVTAIRGGGRILVGDDDAMLFTGSAADLSASVRAYREGQRSTFDPLPGAHGE